MKQKISSIHPACLFPAELSHCLQAMAALDIILSPLEDAWLRLVQKDPERDAYFISNGSGDEMDIFFEESGVLIKGFDHENILNQFAASEWDETFFEETFQGIPACLLDVYEDKESLHRMTFCMWFQSGQWRQNAVEGCDGGKEYLLGYICVNAAEWAEWAEDYFETDISRDIVEKVYRGDPLTEQDVLALNPACDAKAALYEIEMLYHKDE